MECKKCGTIHENDFCPNCGTASKPAKVKKPIFKKWWFWIIIAVVAISIISNSGNTETPSPENNQNTKPTASTNANTNTKPTANETTTTTKPAETKPSETETTSKPGEDNKYYIGDVINANGMNITYISAEKWESDNMFMQPEDGYIYIRLKISAENKSSVDRYISSFEFECYADGKKESASYVGDNTFEGGTLSAGRYTDGYIYFTVPANAKSIEVEYETSFWTDKKAILIVDLK